MAIFYVDTGSFDNLLVTGSLLISGSMKIPISATNPPSETGSFYFNTVSKSLFTYDGTQWYSGSSGGGTATTVTNFGDNRIITSDGTSTGLNAESNFSFDGSTLQITGSTVISSSTSTPAITLIGSGSTILSISGSNGSVFSINDSTSGSLFAVTDGNGQPIFDVQSSGRVFVGSTSNGYSYEELTRQTLILTGTSSIYTIPTSSYGSFIMDYTITSGSAPTPGVRTGTLYSTWFGGLITVSDAGVATIGDSTGFVFNAITSSGNVIIQTQVANQPWRLSAYIRVLPV